MRKHPSRTPEKPGAFLDLARHIIGERVNHHADGEKALAPLADLLAGYGISKRRAHMAGLDLFELVEILRRDFLVPVAVRTETDIDGEWPVYLTMRPHEIASFIDATPRGRMAQMERWTAVLKANDTAHAVRCTIELYAELGFSIDPKAARALTEPRPHVDLNAGDSFALINARQPVAPVAMPDSRIDAEWEKGSR